MARVDDLPADQKAVIQLLLKQGKTYDELAALLRLDGAGVRDRALDALDALGAEREAENREAEALQATMDAGVPDAVARWMS